MIVVEIILLSLLSLALLPRLLHDPTYALIVTPAPAFEIPDTTFDSRGFA